MISAIQLQKKFGDTVAVDGIDLEVKKGECFGLLGPNGAGKSTVIGMLYGSVLRTGGSLKVFGMDPNSQSREIKKKLGVVTQENALDESLSVEENLNVYSKFQGIKANERKSRITELLSYMEMAENADSKIQFLSGGFKRRLVFVRALLRNPELLILDEPTTGLDPGVRHLLWDKVRELKSKGLTVLLTTHYMHEAEALADRVAIMNHGRILVVDTPQNLIAQHGEKNLEGVFLRLTGERLREDA